MKVGFVILAAGESARMGEPKQMLGFRGTSLLRHTIDTAGSIPGGPVVVVLGAHAARIRTHLVGSSAVITENLDWRDGIGSSLRSGLAALIETSPEVTAAIFLVCDQPMLSSYTLSLLITIHERTERVVVASQYRGVLGLPALFGRSLFPDLLALRGSDEARQIIRKYRLSAMSVPFPGGAVDVDTPGDYARLFLARDNTPVLASV